MGQKRASTERKEECGDLFLMETTKKLFCGNQAF
jgi:hypothetical protein